MKTRLSRRQTANVSHIRWLAYATAGAATALVGSNSVEAAIHYSDILKVQFPPGKDKAKKFQLDQHGDSFKLIHRNSFGSASFDISGIQSGGFRGHIHSGVGNYLVSKLSFGQNISSGSFVNGRQTFNILAGSGGEWHDPGVGFIGFRFNSGAGIQYGWARVRMLGDSTNAFKLIDYAYADPGEPITAGQKSSAEQAPDQSSLGWLALGAVGLIAWRKNRSRVASPALPV